MFARGKLDYKYELMLPCLQVYLVNANKTDVLLLIGAIYYQLGNYEQCIAFNDRCILLDPHMAEAHANLANALQQLGNFDMAVIYYQVCMLALHTYRHLQSPDNMHCAAAAADAFECFSCKQCICIAALWYSSISCQTEHASHACVIAACACACMQHCKCIWPQCLL